LHQPRSNCNSQYIQRFRFPKHSPSTGERAPGRCIAAFALRDCAINDSGRQKLAITRPKRWKSASHSTSIRAPASAGGRHYMRGRRSAQRSLTTPNNNGGHAAGKRNR
jgi:hypothetical protein